MPGRKSIYTETYLTDVEVYREGIAVADTVPPGVSNLPTVDVPAIDAESRVGRENEIAFMVMLTHAGMTITCRLWRLMGGYVYECTPVAWVAITRSTMLQALHLPAGQYMLTVTGTFVPGAVNIRVQHTE